MVKLAAPNEAVFRYPFEGRPKPAARLGAFVLSPDTYLKLFGMSPRVVFAEQGLGPEYRRLKRALDGETDMSNALNALADIFSALEPAPFLKDFRSALGGDEMAVEQANSYAEFDSLFLGAAEGDRSLYGTHSWFLILLERMSVACATLLHAGDAAGAARRIAKHPLLHNLLWPQACSLLKKASSAREADPLMGSLLLEGSLATIAAWDVQLNRLHRTTHSYFEQLIPSTRLPGRNPTSLFFDELERRLGAHSIGEIVNSPQNLIAGIEQWTLNRWSAGTHSPDYDSVNALLAAHGLADSKEVLYAQFWCSKQLHLIGHLAQTIRAAANTVPDEHRSILWPWPDYPFGHANFEAWAAARYPQWRSAIAEHAEQLPSLVAKEEPASDGR